MPSGPNSDQQQVIRLTANYIQEAKSAKRERLEKNKQNFDVYHLKQDFSHKREGQSREFLAKQSMAVEQISSFFLQGLIDTDRWFSVRPEPGVKNPLITENEAYLLLSRQLEKADVMAFIEDSLKLGLLGSLMIAKVGGQFYKKPHFYTETRLDGFRFKKVLKKADHEFWRLKLDLLRQDDYHPDPNWGQNGKPLYECQDMWMDIHEVYSLSEGKAKIYDKASVESVAKHCAEEDEKKAEKAREHGQDVAMSNFRSRVKVTECWGTILDENGRIVMENATWSIANDKFLIQEPEPNKLWHGESPYVVSPIIRVPHSVWHKALMDAPTQHNIAANEMYNLMVDGGMMSVHGIKQCRTDWLEDPAQVENGIPVGETLRVSSSCPPGMKVLERVDTSTIGQDGLAIFNLINQEFNQSSLTNDLRMGTMPARQVKATEVVEASQTITSVFTGITKVIENKFENRVLHKSWMTCLQNMDDLDSGEVEALIGETRASELANISPEDRFARCSSYQFKTSGVSSVLSKVKDFRKLTGLLQTVAGSDVLLEEFMKRFSIGKFLGEVVRSLDIDTSRIEIDEEERAALLANSINMQAGTAGPNMQSQIPQASAGTEGETVESRIPRTDFPRTSGGVKQ